MRIASLEFQKQEHKYTFDLAYESNAFNDPAVLETLKEILFNLPEIDAYSTSTIQSFSLVLEASFGDGFKNIAIFKDFTTNIFDVRVEGEPYAQSVWELISAEWGGIISKEVWQSRFVDFSTQLSTQDSDSEVINALIKANFLIDPTLKGFLEEEDEKQVALQKIQTLEVEIENYKNARNQKEELEGQIEELNTSITKSKETLGSSEGLILLLNRIDIELKKFGYLSVEKDLSSKIKFIKKTRIQKVITALKNIRDKAAFLTNDNTNSSGTGGSNYGGYFLLLIAVQLGLSTATFIVTKNPLVIALSLILLLLILVGLFYLKLSMNISLDNSQKSLIAKSKLNHSEYAATKLLNNFSANEDSLLINVAWVNALKEERVELEKALNKELGGVSYKDLIAGIEASQWQINDLNQKLNDLDAKKITAEEYLKKRRELDILKLDLNDSNSSELSTGGSNDRLEVIKKFSKLPFILFLKKENQALANAAISLADMLKSSTQLIVLQS